MRAGDGDDEDARLTRELEHTAVVRSMGVVKSREYPSGPECKASHLDMVVHTRVVWVNKVWSKVNHLDCASSW